MAYMIKKQINFTFHHVTLIPTMLEITSGMLEAFKEQLCNMKIAKEKPQVLDDDIVNRFLELCKKQNEDAVFFLQQCNIWKQEELTELQLKQVQEIENNTHLLTDINNQLLAILDYCKDFTIDKILEKDDMELALDVLRGKIPFPKI
jgi:hypothetical protein